MLVLTNEDVQRVISLPECMAALEEAFLDLEAGQAVERPRSHTYTPLPGRRYYLFKSMDGGLKRHRVHAVRMTSDLVQEVGREGTLRREKIPAAPGGNYVGMVILFSMDSLEPLALIQDGLLQRTRVGATSGLAAKYLAPRDAREAGLVGTGWQAGAQLLALQYACPGIEKVYVYSPNGEHRAAFCREFEGVVPFSLVPVNNAAQAVKGRRLWILATNSLEPVVDGNWLLPDTHVNSIQGREVDRKTLERADRVVVRSALRPSHWAPPGFTPLEVRRLQERGVALESKTVSLGSVIARGLSREPGWITVFGGGGTGGSAGLGVQFAAVANLVYGRAREAKLGLEVDGRWFRQPYPP